MTTAVLSASGFAYAAAPHTSRHKPAVRKASAPVSLLPAFGTVLGLLAAAALAGAQAWMFIAY